MPEIAITLIVDFAPDQADWLDVERTPKTGRKQGI